MLASFLLSLREGLEAALIISVVLGVLRKLQRKEMNPVVWWGTTIAVGFSIGLAVLFNRMGVGLEGRTEEIFEGITMLLAAGVLTWMVFWMQNQARQVQSKIEQNVQQAASNSGKWALFWLAFLAVAREGFELALFLTAVAFSSEATQTFWGALSGLAVAVLLGVLLYNSTINLNLRRFFQVTSILLILFAAGLVAHGVHEFNEAGWIPSIVENVWDTNNLLSEDSIGGQILKSLFGYNGNPSLTEILSYFAYFGIIALGITRTNRRVAQPRQA